MFMHSYTHTYVKCIYVCIWIHKINEFEMLIINELIKKKIHKNNKINLRHTNIHMQVFQFKK